MGVQNAFFMSRSIIRLEVRAMHHRVLTGAFAENGCFGKAQYCSIKAQEDSALGGRARKVGEAPSREASAWKLNSAC